ncbi:MAG: phage major capsid protein [Thiomonas sp.]
MTLQTRELALGKPDLKSRTVPVLLSTDTPVDRGDYLEVLDHSPAAIDLSRAPLPLIESHDARGLPIGVVDQLRTDGRKLRGVARFGNSERAQAVLQDVQDGILRSVSIGYEYTGAPAALGDGKTLRFPFKPLEVSAVSVPADPNAGFFRSYPTMNENIEPITPMTRSQRRAASAELEDQRSAAEMERARILEIEALCSQHKMPSSMQRDLIQRGVDIPGARSVVLQEVIRRGEQQASAQTYDASDLGIFPGGLSASDRGRYSVSRAILAAADRDWSRAGFEREVSREIGRRIGRDTAGVFITPDMLVPQRRDYNTLSGAAGGALVATNLAASSFIELLRAQSKVMRLGATVLSGLVGNVDIPRRTAAGPAQWIAEGQALTPGAGAYDVVSLRPKTVGSLSVLSRNLLMQGTPDAEMLVRADMVAQIAIAIDAAAIQGTGAAAQPLGLLNMPGVGSVVGGTDGAPITFDHLIDMSTAVAAANADSGALGYLSTPAVLGALSRLKSTTGEYLWAGRGGVGNENSAPASAAPGSTTSTGVGFGVLGYRAEFSNNVPGNLTKGASAAKCSAVLFGNWSDLLIGEWGVLEILPNPYASGVYEAGAVQVRAMQTIDVAVRHAESFVVMKDALTA